MRLKDFEGVELFKVELKKMKNICMCTDLVSRMMSLSPVSMQLVEMQEPIGTRSIFALFNLRHLYSIGRYHPIVWYQRNRHHGKRYLRD